MANCARVGQPNQSAAAPSNLASPPPHRPAVYISKLATKTRAAITHCQSMFFIGKPVAKARGKNKTTSVAVSQVGILEDKRSPTAAATRSNGNSVSAKKTVIDTGS